MKSCISHILEPEFISIGTAYFRFDGRLECHIGSYNKRGTINKYAVLCDSSDISSLQWIMSEDVFPSPPISSNAKIYVSSKCKIPRDLYRNTGYKLCRDPEQAEWIVIPDLKVHSELKYDFAFQKDNTLILLTVNRSTDTCYKQTVEDEKGKLLSRFSDCVPLCDKITTSTVLFIDKIKEYKDILSESIPKGKMFTFEGDVTITPMNELSLETLMLWDKTTNNDILLNYLITSDCYKYPITMCVFLRTRKRYFGCGINNDKLRYLFNRIGYLQGENIDSLIYGRNVQPEDWNLLQDWLGYTVNMEGDKCFIDMNDYTNLHNEAKKLLRKKVAVSKIKIASPMLVDNILN